VTAAEIPECRVGDVCTFRPTFGSALVFTNMRAYTRFRSSKLETPDESYQLWRDWEAKGDWAVLQKAMRIRVLGAVDGGIEAVVESDDYRRAPNGGIGMVGTKIAGHKVWLESRLAEQLRSLYGIKRKIMVEAGGVEPPSEKARNEETTCVSGSKLSATASEPARAAAA
jgi:hypothetical protein